MKPVIALLLLLALSCRTATPSAPPADPALHDIDAFVANVVRTIPDVPSVSLAIVHNGRRYTRAFGYADVENRIAATPTTGYYIGSTTKAFTGLVAAMAAERGQIDLDAPIGRYLPEVRFNAPIDAEKITLRRLMSHSAPITNRPIVFRTAFSGDHSPSLLVRLLNESKPRDEGFRYDNLGYVIAGLALERVTGRTWQQLHDERIFTPLGMGRSTALMSEAQRWALAQPYEMSGSGRVALLREYRKNDQMMHAAGGTVTTADDLARWLEAQLTAGRVDGRQAISATAIAETHRQHGNPEPRGPFAGRAYGFGWYRGMHGGDALVYHGGGFEGWRAYFSFMPERNIAVGVMTNSGVGNPVTALITQYVYDRLLDKPNAESDYAAKLTRLRSDFDAETVRVSSETKNRAQRVSQLRHEPRRYAGTYENASWGTITIEERGGKLYASMGAMRSELAPYTEPETARVELIPANGEVLKFVFSNGSTPDALRYRDDTFTRRP